MITNSKRSRLILIVFSSIWILLISAFSVTFFDFIKTPMWVPLILALALVLIALWFYLGGFHFFRVEIKEEILKIKYYNLFPVGRKFQTIHIPLKQYHHFQINTHFGGLSKWLVLYQNFQGGLAKYPPLGLSSTSQTVLKELKKLLSEIKGSTT